MAAITATVTRGQPGRATQVFWEQINQDDTGAAIEVLEELVEGTIHFFGTFDSGTWSLTGSIDGTNFDILKDIAGNAISATANSTFHFRTLAKNLAIAQAAGTTSDVDVQMLYKPVA